MANYSKLDGYVFDIQSNTGWGLTLKMSGKAPAVAKRIFDKLDNAQSYIDDVNDTAIEGLVLSVVDDGDNNGVYFVQSVGKKSEVEGGENINGVLVKLSSEDYTDAEIEANTKTYSIVKATEEEVETLGANVKEAYKLVDEDNVKVGEYILVYKDSALKSAELIDQQLVFTYTLADNTEQVVKIDVSTFLAESEFKNGLDVNQNGEVSVKVDAASETFLTVGTDGIKLAGVQDAIDIEQARAEGVESGLEEKINNKSQIVDVTSLFKNDGTLEGYTMQQLANSHLVYKYENENVPSINGTPYVQVSMVGGSPSNSTMVTYGNDVNINLGMYYTLIAEIYSEQDGKYILTQYLARVRLFDSISSSTSWITENVEQHILATQESIDTLSTEVNAALDEKQDAIDAEQTRAEGVESALSSRLAVIEGDGNGSIKKAVADAKAAETAARNQAIANTKTELEGKINNKSQIVDVTSLFTSDGTLFTSGGTLEGYTMQQLANSHLVYRHDNGPNGTSSVQVTMVAGSAGNSTVVIDDTTTIPTFGNYCTLIFEMHSEGILTQYVAYVEYNNNTFTTTKVNSYVLATQESIDTLSTEVNTKLNKKQDIIPNLETIERGAALGATSVQMIDVTSLFTEGNSMTGYTLSDLTTNKLYHSDGNTSNAVKYVGYGDSANEANLVMESFEGAVRNISIAHIKLNGSTLTTDSVKTYSSNVFVMRVSQVDYDTMKAAGTLDENTLYVISEVTQ